MDWIRCREILNFLPGRDNAIGVIARLTQQPMGLQAMTGIYDQGRRRFDLFQAVENGTAGQIMVLVVNIGKYRRKLMTVFRLARGGARLEGCSCEINAVLALFEIALTNKALDRFKVAGANPVEFAVRQLAISVANGTDIDLPFCPAEIFADKIMHCHFPPLRLPRSIARR